MMYVGFTYIIKWMNLKSDFCLYLETEGVHGIFIFWEMLTSAPEALFKDYK